MEIPKHLRHLPTWRGLPVPYINCWGDEVDEHAWRIDTDPNVREPVFFTGGTRGEGDAFLAKQCLQRQRECVIKELCQVCRRRLTHKWLFVWSASTAKVELEVAGTTVEVPAVSEPFMCTKCVPYVLSICPGVRRRLDELLIMRVRHHKVLLSRGWHDDHGEDVQAVMWAKIIPLGADTFEADELPAGVAA